MLKNLRIPLLLTALIVLFQNCSQEEGLRSHSYRVVPPKETNAIVTDGQTGDDFSEIPDNGSLGNPDPNAPVIDAESCARDYVTLFGWTNPAANLMNEPPVLSTHKLVTVHVGSVFSSSAVTSGWRIENILQPTSSGTQLTLKVVKADTNSADSLDCYLVRFSDPSELNSGLANILYSNLGGDKTANILSGFLRHPKQYIACQVNSGNGSINIVNSDGRSESMDAHQPFVIKRGCYQ